MAIIQAMLKIQLTKADTLDIHLPIKISRLLINTIQIKPKVMLIPHLSAVAEAKQVELRINLITITIIETTTLRIHL